MVGMAGLIVFLLGFTLFGSRAASLVPALGAIVLGVPWVMILFGWVGNGDSRCVWAMRHRIRFMRSNEDDAKAREIRIRRAFWLERLRHPLSNLACRQLGTASLVVRVLMLESLTVAGYFVAYRDASRQMTRIPLWFLAVIAVGLVVYLAAIAWRERRIKARLIRSLIGTECSDCGYKIDRGPPIPTSGGESVGAGPLRCPECGCVWPLIPPPVWLVETEEGERQLEGTGQPRSDRDEVQ